MTQDERNRALHESMCAPPYRPLHVESDEQRQIRELTEQVNALSRDARLVAHRLDNTREHLVRAGERNDLFVLTGIAMVLGWWLSGWVLS